MSKIRRYAVISTVVYLIAITVFFAVFVWRPRPSVTTTSEHPKHEPEFTGLGNHVRTITTASEEAQRYFDQGLAFLYGFNHDEAIRSFEAAARADSYCPMAYWGIAMANGPHINNMVVNAAHAKAAWKAVMRARKLRPRGSAVERALIEAVGERFADPQPSDRKPLDSAYATAMKSVWSSYPDDADVGALTAEALMDLHPWNQWTREGQARPGTDELLQILDTVLAKNPNHPLALHLLIHAVEASPHPERADVAADRLRDLMPGLDHLLHMPSHIDVRRGRWENAVIANEKAISCEKKLWKIALREMSYQIPMAHNHHMLAFAAMMQGQSQKAIEAVREMLSIMPPQFVKDHATTVDGFFAMPYELHLRFGHWNEMLEEPQPKPCYPIAKAFWHYGRGIAFAAKLQSEQAEEEMKAFLKAEAAVPKEATFRKTPASNLLGIAEQMLLGEVLYRTGKVEPAITALREAVRREDDLHYSEPPNWIFPVRHALGATLMDAGRYADAEIVYRQDLAHYPENGWSLFGLSRSLRMQNKLADATAVDERFEKAWRHADIKLSSSCFCLRNRNGASLVNR